MLKAIGMAAAALLMTAGMAHATKVKVHNCTDASIVVKSYNGKDKTYALHFKKKTIGADSVRTLKCKGQGKDRCKVKIWKRSGDKSSGVRKISKNKTLYITSVERQRKSGLMGTFYRTKITTSDTGCN